ncbi:HET-domain-containing protein [Lentithecium fluviatile CBS 122367]|uniref:HET-domain-containing protein n=1 Tax=Lentithecium fluviatile CBS 122367 TaxID=1168545 RepID=A0A6G1J2J6_9PLEO|nr:HET-domain-containing protein [Lentithecium fluviatile CBS 122367]
MRLLSVDKDGKLCLTEFHQNIPPYAVLSHTWRPDGGEVLFKNVNDGSAREKAGYNKVAFCRETAASHGLKYFWVDTCCIDKSSSSELQESINSMFSYYRGANRCYVYLADVSVRDYDLSSHSSQRSLETSFRNSRWFTRGWTLQELIAPSSVEFYSQEGKRLGDKHSLGPQIHEATGIPVSAFQGAPLSGFDIEARLRWSKGRQTTREEDWAYSLFGIFDVCLPLLYGEGRTKAITRLMREIHLGSRGKCLVR